MQLNLKKMCVVWYHSLYLVDVVVVVCSLYPSCWRHRFGCDASGVLI